MDQGQTIRTTIDLNLGDKEDKHGLSYVVFYIATKLSNIVVSGCMGRKCLTTKILQVKKLVKRLEEDQRLDTVLKEITFKSLDLDNH